MTLEAGARLVEHVLQAKGTFGRPRTISHPEQWRRIRLLLEVGVLFMQLGSDKTKVSLRSAGRVIYLSSTPDEVESDVPPLKTRCWPNGD